MKSESGQGLVEFALVLMFIILPLTFVFIEVALLLFVQSNVVNATIEGARQGSVYIYNSQGANPLGCTSWNPIGTLDSQVDTLDCWRKGSIQDYLKNDPNGRLRNLVDVDSCSEDITYTQPITMGNPYRAMQPLRLDLACPHHMLFGLVGESYITVSGTSTMRIEPGSGITEEVAP